MNTINDCKSMDDHMHESLPAHERANDKPFNYDPAEVDAEALMNGGREAIIIHNGERYRLRITSKQRLILTK